MKSLVFFKQTAKYKFSQLHSYKERNTVANDVTFGQRFVETRALVGHERYEARRHFSTRRVHSSRAHVISILVTYVYTE